MTRRPLSRSECEFSEGVHESLHSRAPLLSVHTRQGVVLGSGRRLIRTSCPVSKNGESSTPYSMSLVPEVEVLGLWTGSVDFDQVPGVPLGAGTDRPHGRGDVPVGSRASGTT